MWFPFTVAALGAVSIVLIRLQPELERNFKGWLTALIVGVGVLLVLGWFLFFSRVSGRVRVAGAFAMALTLAVLGQIVRVDGTMDGTGLPKLIWRWEVRHPAAVSAKVTTIPLEKVPALSGAANVPQFFGPDRTGVVTGAHLSRDWQTTPPRELWRQPAGAGWSAFAVVGGRAFTQEQRGEEEAVTCYDLLTGKLQWVHTDPARFQQWQGGEGPRATPTVHEGRVFTYGATGILNCLDAATGQKLWSRSVLAEEKLENITWGLSASPLVFDDTVVVTGGMKKESTVLAYRRSTGEPLWKVGSDQASYASPVLATVAGKRVIVSFNSASLTLHDPATGKVLLRYPWSDDKWPKASQPVVIGGDCIFISAGYGAGCEMIGIKHAHDGTLAGTQLWKNLRMKTQFNSAAFRDGYLYGLDDGLLACVDAATGERKWKGGRYGSGQTLVVDDLVIVQSEAGPVALCEAKPDAFQELGRLPALSAKTWNHPTLAGRYLLLRNSEEMVCYELPVQ